MTKAADGLQVEIDAIRVSLMDYQMRIQELEIQKAQLQLENDMHSAEKHEIKQKKDELGQTVTGTDLSYNCYSLYSI